jgi:methyltransferase (TIGR00027 family)
MLPAANIQGWFTMETTDTNGAVEHVSDTARMTAACRAMEWGRLGALVRDPFARRLAGERGLAIARGLPDTELMCFGIALRDRFFDDLLLEAVDRHQIRTVLCVGAGLDARPWRLDLPSSLRWIETDFPAILDYKHERLAGETPRCRLERMTADLHGVRERAALWAAVGAGPALMLTEGVLPYLSGDSVHALAREAAANSGIRIWLSDFNSTAFSKHLGLNSWKAIEDVRSAGHLDGDGIWAAVHAEGWQSVAKRTFSGNSGRVAAVRLLVLLARGKLKRPAARRPENDFSGVHLLTHA